MTAHDDITTGAVMAFAIALCPDPDCDPATYRLCANCNRLLDAQYPELCGDPDCYPCTRGAAGAARAEQ